MTASAAQYSVNPPAVRDKQTVPLQCDQFGNLKVAIGGVVTINGGDASAANQTTQIASVGIVTASPVATSDTGNFSLLSLFKRLLTRIVGPVGLTQGTPTIQNVVTAAGGVSVVYLAANPLRRYLMLQNNSTDPIWVTWDGSPANDGVGFQLKADATWENPPHYCATGAISVWSPLSGQAFVISEG